MKVELKSIKKCYGEQIVLDVPDICLPSEKIIAIVGPNGAGKSTFLNIVADLLEPDTGEVLYDEKREVPSSKITLVFQKPYLLTTTVKENILYPMKLRHFSQEKMKEQLEEVTKKLRLSQLLNKKANQLSLGEMQKVALARALVFEPDLLLLDEPCASLDPYTTLEMEQALKTMNEQKKTTIYFVTHNLAQAKRLADFVILIHQGRIEECSSKDTFFYHSEHSKTKAFIEGELLL